MKRILILSGLLWQFLFVSVLFGQSLEYLGSTLWAEITDVCVQDTFAYCSFPSGVEIFSIADPSNPAYLNKIELPYGNYSIEISDTLVFLGCKGNFKIINVVNPLHLSLVSVTSISGNNPVIGLKVSGNYIYMITESRSSLIIYDFNDPTNPQFVSSTNMAVWEFAVNGNNLFAGRYIYHNDHGYEWYSGYLAIYDITNRANPTLSGELSTDSSRIGGINVNSNTVYLSCENGCLIIADISNPGQPQRISQYCDGRLAGLAVGIYLNNQNIYIVRGSGGGGRAYLHSFNVQSPNAPDFIRVDSIGAFAPCAAFEGNLLISGHSFYAPCLKTINIANPNNPQVLGKYNFPSRLQDIIVSDTLAFVLSYFGGFFVLNITDPTNPIFVSQGCLPYYREYSDFAIHDNYLFLVSPTYGAYIFDVSNPYFPIEVSAISGFFGEKILVSDGLAFFQYGRDQLIYIFDIHNIYNPQELSSYQFPRDYLQSIYVKDTLLFASLEYSYTERQFAVLSISDPSHPTLLSSLNSPSDYGAYQIEVVDTLAYLIAARPPLQIINIADPLNPTIVYGSSESCLFKAFAISYPYAFICSDCWNGSSLLLDDISNNSSNIIGTYPVVNGKGVAYLNDIVFVADTFSLKIYRFNTTDVENGPQIPQEFSLSQNYPNPFNPATTIRYSLPSGCPVRLTIYNILGQQVTTILNAPQTAGEHQFIWDASAFPSGLYFARLEAGEKTQTIKMVLLK